jgi:hypothetical protein
MEGVSGRTERWFNAGAGALRRTLTAYSFTNEVAELDRRYPDGAYACPCCLVAYGPGALTDEPRTLIEEHVPPELAGGKKLLLTCAPCNNASGRVWDVHASRHQHLLDAVFGGVGHPAQTTLTIGGFPVRGRFDGAGAMASFEYVLRANDPAAASAAGAFLERAIGAGTEIEFQISHTGRSTATPRPGPGLGRHTSPPSRCTATGTPSCEYWNQCGSGSQARSPFRRSS